MTYEIAKANNIKIPDGWRMTKLREVCRIVGGSTPSTSVDSYWDGDIVWVTPTDLGRLVDVYIETSERKISVLGYKSCPAEIVPEGSVIMSSRAPIGHLGIANTTLCTNQGCKSFVPGENIDSKFLYYSLKLTVPELRELGSGSTFAEISKSSLETFEIPLPPTIEKQHRIAAILDEQIKAVELALRAVEEQSYAADLLPNAFLRSVFESENTLGWVEYRLGDVCRFVGGSQPPAHTFSRKPSLNSVRLVQIQDFRRDDLAVYISKDDAKRTFDETDVMIGRYGPPVFQILRGLAGAYNVALIKTEPDEQFLLKDFLFYLLQWEKIQSLVIAQSQRSAGQSGVPKDFLEELKVRLPLIEEQVRLVELLRRQSEGTEPLRNALSAEKENLTILPSVILRAAFAGRI